MDIGKIIKEERTKRNLTQEQLAQEFFVTRQLISKWENGRGYPDIENLILLSDLYQVSIDELLRENEALKERIETNNQEINDKKEKLSLLQRTMATEKDESLLLLLLAGIGSFLFPLGLILDGFVLWRNKKANNFYVLIYIVCAFSIFLNLYDGYVHLSNIMNWGTTTIEKVE